MVYLYAVKGIKNIFKLFFIYDICLVFITVVVYILWFDKKKTIKHHLGFQTTESHKLSGSTVFVFLQLNGSEM